MFERYDIERYRFIPPFRSTFWCRLGQGLVPRHLTKAMKVARWHFEGLDWLRDSLRQGAGILLTPNHSRWADPMVIAQMGLACPTYFYYVASYHLFLSSRVMGWVMNRLGSYSIWREGADRESLRTTSQLLADAERPVVLFPEGTWFRQNDRVGPLQEGLSLIVRQAARQSDRPLHILPVGIKYWMLEDPRPELARRVEKMERKLGWAAQSHLKLVERLEKLGGALLALKEIEYLGSSQKGTLDERIANLVSARVVEHERVAFGKEFDGWPLERIRRLRQVLVRRLLGCQGKEEVAGPLRQALGELLFCENLSAHSQDYLREDPTYERLTETVQRIEETVTDEVEVPVCRMGATVCVGPALDGRALSAERAGREEPDPLVQKVRSGMQALVDALRGAGPPREWGCPARTDEG